MAEFIDVLGVYEIASGQMKKVNVGGEEILLARVDDNFYAVQHKCTHMKGPLSTGTLSGKTVTCPAHHSQFDLTDGHVVRWTDWTGIKLSLAKMVKPPRSLKTYKIKVEGNRIFIESAKVAMGAGT